MEVCSFGWLGWPDLPNIDPFNYSRSPAKLTVEVGNGVMGLSTT